MQYVASARGRWKVVFKKRPKLLKAAKPFIRIELWFAILGSLLLGAIPFIPVLGMGQFFEVLVFDHVIYE
jgi:hypothetical protein